MIEQQLKMPEGATIFDWSQFVLILERASRHGQGPVVATISCPIAAHILAALRHYESKAEHGRCGVCDPTVQCTLQSLADQRDEANAKYESLMSEHDGLAAKLEAAERDCDEWERRYNVAEADRRRELDHVAKYCDIVGERQRRINELEAVGLEMLRALESGVRYESAFSYGWIVDLRWDDSKETAYNFITRLQASTIAKAKNVFKPAELTLTERLRERLAEGASTMLKPDEIRELLDAIDGKANSPVKP